MHITINDTLADKYSLNYSNQSFFPQGRPNVFIEQSCRSSKTQICKPYKHNPEDLRSI